MSTPHDESISLGLINEAGRNRMKLGQMQAAAGREQTAWDRVDELNEECDELAAEVRRLKAQNQTGSGESRQDKDARLTQTNNNAWAVENHQLKEQLSRSKALNRLTMINNKALLETINHLKKSWHPDDPKETEYKEKIRPLFDEKMEQVNCNTEELKKIDDSIENYVNPKKRGPRP